MTTAEFNQCVDACADGVYRFVLKNLRDEDKARDVVQDSFEKLWIKAEEIPREKAKSYLFTTAYHGMIDQIRRDKFSAGLDEAALNSRQIDHSYSDLRDVLNRGLEKLPEIQRSVLLLRDYEGYAYREIGEICGLNESQVKVYIYRARMFLKQYIGSMDVVI